MTNVSDRVVARPGQIRGRDFSALADPTRALLAFALTRRELSVNALAELAGVSASAVSHHLARLRGIRLVRARRAGNQVFYSVGDAHVATLFREALCHQDHVRRGLDDHAPRVKATKI